MKTLEQVLAGDPTALYYLVVRSRIDRGDVGSGTDENAYDIVKFLGTSWRKIVAVAEHNINQYSSSRQIYANQHKPEEWCKQAFELGYIEVAMRAKQALEQYEASK